MALKRHVLTKIHFKMQTVTFDGLKIERVTEEVFYITLGNLVVYIDNSTGENYVSKWIEDKMIITAENVH